MLGSRFGMYQCEVCHKGFTGFMKQALRCDGKSQNYCSLNLYGFESIKSFLVDCYVMVHRHCEDRVPPCKAQIESGSYVTMSRNKVVKRLRDLDSLSQFLLDKVMYSFR